MTGGRFHRATRSLCVLYGSWLGMLALHESGHALAGWMTGGHVQRIVLPLWGFSRTDVSPNPQHAVEVWAGPLWGMCVPFVLWMVVARARRTVWPTWKFFAGFCLVVNGAYIAVGWAAKAGDPWELERLGTPPWMMVVTGVAAVSAGLFIWHRLGGRDIVPREVLSKPG